MSFKPQGQFNLLKGLVQTVVLSKYEDNPFYLLPSDSQL
jgi:hypothetical protein